MTDTTKLAIVRAHDGTFLWDTLWIGAARAEAMHRALTGQLPAWQCIETLRSFISLIRCKAEDFSLLIAHEGGKAIGDARVEVARVINGYDPATFKLGHHAGTEIPKALTKDGAGRRTSGLGTGGIGHTMADMNEDKMIVIRT